MTLTILSYDELPPRLERERLALTLGAFSGVLDRRALSVLRGPTAGTPEYLGLFAVDRGRLVGETLVLRMPYRGARGATRVAGIAMVTTRVDVRRQGVATTLLEEAHRREAARGVEFALLWTSQGWYAHRLYEKLGYRDVYTPSLALQLLDGAEPPSGSVALRRARPGEFPDLEALHAEVTAGAFGFVPRTERFLQRRHAAGDRLGGLLVGRRRGRLVGYVVVSEEPRQLRCGELVARPDDVPDLLDALEHRARRGLLSIENTPVRRYASELRERGYLVRREHEWRVLMARRLVGRPGGGSLRRELAVDRPGFACQRLDRF